MRIVGEGIGGDENITISREKKKIEGLAYLSGVRRLGDLVSIGGDGGRQARAWEDPLRQKTPADFRQRKQEPNQTERGELKKKKKKKSRAWEGSKGRYVNYVPGGGDWRRPCPPGVACAAAWSPPCGRSPPRSRPWRGRPTAPPSSSSSYHCPSPRRSTEPSTATTTPPPPLPAWVRRRPSPRKTDPAAPPAHPPPSSTLGSGSDSSPSRSMGARAAEGGATARRRGPPAGGRRGRSGGGLRRRIGGRECDGRQRRGRG